MKIVCPSCAATYEVPEAVVATGREVRCARCGVNWAPDSIVDQKPPERAPHQDKPVQDLPSQDPPSQDRPSQDPPSQDRPAPEVSDEDALNDAGRAAAAPVAVADPSPPPLPAPPPPPAPSVARPAPVSARMAGSLATAAAPTPPRTASPTLGWAASFAAILLLASSGIVFRAAIMKAWPASERLYAAIGLYRP